MRRGGALTRRRTTTPREDLGSAAGQVHTSRVTLITCHRTRRRAGAALLVLLACGLAPPVRAAHHASATGRRIGTAAIAGEGADLSNAYGDADEDALDGTPFGTRPPADPLAGTTGIRDTYTTDAPVAVGAATVGTQFAGMNSIQPVRLLDTRSGIGAPAGPLGEAKVITVAIRGQGGIPSDADTVVLNVTATEPSAGGYITVWPTGVPQPNASNLNTLPGVTVPNLVVTRIGADGTVSIANAFGTVHLLADAVAWSRADNHFRSVSPQRILDTRTGLGMARALGANETGELQITGVAGLPSTGVGVAVLNVTATRPTATGFLTVYPSGATRPNASNLNFLPDQTVPNLVFATVGTNGRISIYNALGSVDVLADLVGWIPSGGSFIPLTPTRVMDTRLLQGDYGLANSITSTLTKPAGRLPAARVDLDLRASYSAFGTFAAYVFNITVTNPSSDGFLSVWPAGTTQPQVSSLNYRAGQTIANAVVMRPGTLGRVSFAIPTGSTDVIVDLVGLVPLQNSLDTPDDRGGSSFHVLFVQGSDAPNDPSVVPAIRNEVAALDGYLAAQTGRHLNLDTVSNQVEITTWRIPTLTTAQLIAFPEDPFLTVLTQIAQDGFGNPYTRRWLVYIDGDRRNAAGGGGGLCGVTIGQWTTLFRGSACGTVNGTITADQVGVSANSAQVALHEMFHGLGAVPSCAQDYANSTATDPNYSPSARIGHTSIPNDLMYWNAGVQPKSIDVLRRSYWGTNSTTCTDLAQSPYIAKP